MTTNPWDFLIEKYDAQIVGGEILVMREGKHTVIGFINAGQVVLNEIGQELAKVAPLDHDGDQRRGGKRGKNKDAAPVEPEPAAEPTIEQVIAEVQAEQAVEEGTAHSLELADTTVTDETVG